VPRYPSLCMLTRQPICARSKLIHSVVCKPLSYESRAFCGSFGSHLSHTTFPWIRQHDGQSRAFGILNWNSTPPVHDSLPDTAQNVKVGPPTRAPILGRAFLCPLQRLAPPWHCSLSRLVVGMRHSRPQPPTLALGPVCPSSGEQMFTPSIRP